MWLSFEATAWLLNPRNFMVNTLLMKGELERSINGDYSEEPTWGSASGPHLKYRGAQYYLWLLITLIHFHLLLFHLTPQFFKRRTCSHCGGQIIKAYIKSNKQTNKTETNSDTKWWLPDGRGIRVLNEIGEGIKKYKLAVTKQPWGCKVQHRE